MIPRFLYFLLLLLLPASLFAQDATEIVRAAIDYWRDTTSYTEAEMTVHRPDWSRSMSLRAWTKGQTQSLVRFTSPAKDAGNASLRDGRNMWSFSPKVNKVIKIPPSMMTQSWMGSDFSYNDLTKGDDIVKLYTHRLLNSIQQDGHTHFEVEAIPFEDAAVVWGKEVLTIRDDHIMLRHRFFDQEGRLIKELTAREIGQLGGKLIAKRIRMEKVEEANTWTEMAHQAAQFRIEFPESTFTLANLSNPQE